MKSKRKTYLLTFAGFLALAVCVPAIAQQSAEIVSPDLAASTPGSTPQNTPAADDNWHIGITPYIWFAGLHGTVGALGYDSSVHAGFGDVFEYLNIGLMGAVEARKGRILLPVDFMWMKLSDDKGLPLSPFPGITSVKVKVDQSLLTPKFGYRLLDQQKLKADGTFGIRYFHLGENLSLQPSGLLSNRSQSANWVDAVAGGRLTMPVSPKAAIMVLGDAGAGGANLDYQVAGLLSYQVKPKIVLQAGWRYLYVNYRPNSGASFVYDMTTSGIILGATFNIK